MALNSPFLSDIGDTINKIKYIISSPNLVKNKYDTLISLHNSLNSMMSSYYKASHNEIIDDYNKIMKKMNEKCINQKMNILKPELYDIDIYEMLKDNVTNNKKDIEKIKKYMGVKKEIYKALDNYENDIKQFEKNMLKYEMKLKGGVKFQIRF